MEPGQMVRRESRVQLQDYGADTMARLPTRPQPRCRDWAEITTPLVLHLEVQGVVVGASHPSHSSTLATHAPDLRPSQSWRQRASNGGPRSRTSSSATWRTAWGFLAS